MSRGLDSHRSTDRIDRDYAQPLDVEALAHLSRRFREAYSERRTPIS